MKKKDLIIKAGISNASIVKIERNENITMNALIKICKVLNCDIGDIVETVPDKASEELR